MVNSSQKILVNSVGQAWFIGFIVAISILLLLNTLAKYTKVEFYNKIFCPSN